ncbi:rap GTPase-activating protein-like protein, partial [Euroglyphus maynei]
MASHCFVCQLPILSHQTWDTWTCGPGIGPTQSIFTDIFHEDCLHCSVCMSRLKQGNGSAKRVGNKIYCVLHFGDVTGSFCSPGEDYINKLRDFKRQSLGCAEARRKSSTTLSFAVPVQACPGQPYCSKFPHDVKPTTGYWIECRGGASPVNINEIASAVSDSQQQMQQKFQQQNRPATIDASDNNEMVTTIHLTNELNLFQTGGGSTSMKPPPTPTVEAVLTRGRLERQDTIKTDHNDQMDNFEDDDGRPMSKDDLDLVRKPSLMGQQIFPNITITIVQPSSPPPSPPLGGTSGSNKQQPSQQQSANKSTHHQYAVKYKPSDYGDGNCSSVKTSPVKPQSPGILKSDDPFKLISFEEEIYEKYFYGREHWNYFTNDEALGPVIMSLKQETIGGRDQFRVLLRTISYSLHGLVPTSAICADRYDREAVVRALGDEAGLKPPLVLGQLPSTPDELLKLDQVFVKSELKVGVIYIQGHQCNSEEAILGNRRESALFSEFLTILGDNIKLKGFDKYKGGLDTVHDLTGTESVYTCYKNIEIMFHVSTMLPHEDADPQKLQKKRHIGNDIVCVAFLEADDALFWPGCIKSHFLHTFIVVKTTPRELSPDETRKYTVAVVCRDEVSAFKPYLWHQSEFEK